MSENKLVLIGLVEPQADMVEAFNEWFLSNHVEDTFNAPHIATARCYRAVRDFAGPAPSGYVTIYELTGSDAEQAERVLGEYQRNPDAYPAREPTNGSLKIIGAGWYERSCLWADP
jgi:hypothetical protein